MTMATKEFMWLPKLCLFTKEILWLTYAYRIDYGFYMNLTYTMAEQKTNPYLTPDWCSSKSYLIAKLKGEL